MNVRNWVVSNAEKIIFITADGNRYNLHDPWRRAILNMDGWGMPQPDIAATRGPFQHGVTPTSIRVPPRKISMDIRSSRCSRREYWQERTELLNIFRYNRSNLNSPTLGSLRWYRADGEIRQVDVIAAKGPSFPNSRKGWDSLGFSDTIEFQALNPIIYDPTRVNSTYFGFECSILSTLQFPFTFGATDIIFGGTTCNAVTPITVNYVGTWQEYPQILIGGPAGNLTIVHDQTGLKLALDYIISAGEVVTFDLTYGRKTVTNNLGTSLLGKLTTDSNLGTFAIQPDPIVPGNANTFTVSVDDGTTDTYVIFRYYNRYIGI